jgi:hypothetical protein
MDDPAIKLNLYDELVASGIPRQKIRDFLSKYIRKAQFLQVLEGWEYKIYFSLFEHSSLWLILPTSEESFKIFTDFISATTTLTSIHLVNLKSLSTVQAQQLRSAMTNNKSITTIELETATTSIQDYVDALSSRIQILKLTEIFMHNQTAIALKNYLSNSTDLYELYLHSCDFDEDSLKIFADGLRNNYSIQTINIGTEQNVWESILSAMQDTIMLSAIRAKRIPQNIGEFLSKNSSLTELTVDECRLPDLNTIDVATLAEGLRQNGHLDELNITFSDFDDGCAIKLSEAWNNDSKIRLTSIQLSYTEISYEGLEALMKAWQKNPKLALKQIDLSNNFRSEAKINSLNQPFIEKWLKDHPMVESFDCTAESPAGELFEFPRFEGICENNIRRKKYAAKILVIAQTLLHSNFIDLIIEESLILDMLYFSQDEFDIDENYLVTRAQIVRVWDWTKRRNFKLAFNAQELFLEFVLHPLIE